MNDKVFYYTQSEKALLLAKELMDREGEFKRVLDNYLKKRKKVENFCEIG